MHIVIVQVRWGIVDSMSAPAANYAHDNKCVQHIADPCAFGQMRIRFGASVKCSLRCLLRAKVDKQALPVSVTLSLDALG